MQVRAAGTERFPDSPFPLPLWPLNSGQNLAAEAMEGAACQSAGLILCLYNSKTTVIFSTGAEQGWKRAGLCASTFQQKSELWDDAATEHSGDFGLHELLLFTKPANLLCTGPLALETQQYLFHLLLI